MTAAGQVMSFPLPTLQPAVATEGVSFTISAWFRILSIEASTATLFSMHKTDVPILFFLPRFYIYC